MTTVRTGLLEGYRYPLLVTPDGTTADPKALLHGWLQGNLDYLEQAMLTHGAILFRGFGIADDADFQELVKQFPVEPLPYLGGNTPRTKVRDGIYTSTEITSRYKIKLHNELSFQVNYPHKIFFYCQQPATEGGETILADVRDVYRDIPRQIVQRFQEKQVRYVRVFQERRAYREWLKKAVLTYFHLTWQQLLTTESREEAEAKCRKLGIEFHWRPNGNLVVTNVLPAVIFHPATAEPLWFNHVPSLHFNARTLGRPVYLTRKLLYRDIRDLPTHVYYGDGTPITMAELHPVYDALDRHTVAFPWRQGDVLVVDNRIIAHGRNPFTGPRRVLVSLTRPLAAAARAPAAAA